MANQHSKLRKPRLSVALATYNEGENIGLCLESVKGLADEIVVVDGTSSDKTVEIAKEHGAKVTVTMNPPIFHINKQKAIDKCQGKWILQLDADERVTSRLMEEVKQIVDNETMGRWNSRAVAYYVPRKNYFLGKWLKKGGQYPDYVIRFFKRGKAHLPCKSVHEQMEVDGKVSFLKNHLLHYTAPTFSRYLTNADRYTSLTAQEMSKKKITINLLSIIYYLLSRPLQIFFSLYIRHKGFLDSWQGFVFAFFSGLHYPWAFVKYRRMRKRN